MSRDFEDTEHIYLGHELFGLDESQERVMMTFYRAYFSGLTIADKVLPRRLYALFFRCWPVLMNEIGWVVGVLYRWQRYLRAVFWPS